MLINDENKHDVVMEDLLNNPKAYGLPTFEEFSKNPERWRKAAEDIFSQVDIGSVLGLKNRVANHTYEVSGYKCKTLEECERIALNEGWDLKQLEVCPEIIPLGGDKCEIHVVFKQKKMSTERIVDEAVKSIIQAP